MPNILMPALSPTMEEGKLAKWLKNVGDTVKSGDVIAEIETDKATMEVEAVDEGKLTQILVPEGTENVKVNTPIAVVLGEGETAPAAGPPAPKAEAKAEAKAEKAEAKAEKAEAKATERAEAKEHPPLKPEGNPVETAEPAPTDPTEDPPGLSEAVHGKSGKKGPEPAE